MSRTRVTLYLEPTDTPTIRFTPTGILLIYPTFDLIFDQNTLEILADQIRKEKAQSR